MELPELKKLVSDGKFFSAKFVKRTDGTTRRMLCRTGVKSEGSGRNWNPDDKGLLTVWDCQKLGFRHIPADAVLELRVRGQVITRDFTTERQGLS